MKKFIIMAMLSGMVLGCSQLNFTCVWSDKDFPNLEIKKAVEAGDLEKVEALTNTGANIDQRDGNHISLLHLAAKNGDAKMIKFLISKGAPVNSIIPREFWDFPIFLAKNIDIVKFLIETEADRELIEQILDNTTDFEIIDYLASKGFSNEHNLRAHIKVKGPGFDIIMPLLHRIVIEGNIEAAKIALARGARDYCMCLSQDLRSSEKESCNSPSDIATQLGHPEIAELIKESEAQHDHVEPKFNSKAFENSVLTRIEGVTGLAQTEGRTGCTCLSGCIANGISYADVEYIKGSLEYMDPKERLTVEEVHNFVERAKQLGNSEITKLIEQAPIIGPQGISYEEYLAEQK